nr:MAG TPA: hypothetical protein [Caudoviricetes sp.]
MRAPRVAGVPDRPGCFKKGSPAGRNDPIQRGSFAV